MKIMNQKELKARNQEEDDTMKIVNQEQPKAKNQDE
jgi:hypothetical protein